MKFCFGNVLAHGLNLISVPDFSVLDISFIGY